jgi:hypothetical protein
VQGPYCLLKTKWLHRRNEVIWSLRHDGTSFKELDQRYGLAKGSSKRIYEYLEDVNSRLLAPKINAYFKSGDTSQDEFWGGFYKMLEST